MYPRKSQAWLAMAWFHVTPQLPYWTKMDKLPYIPIHFVRVNVVDQNPYTDNKYYMSFHFPKPPQRIKLKFNTFCIKT